MRASIAATVLLLVAACGADGTLDDSAEPSPADEPTTVAEPDGDADGAAGGDDPSTVPGSGEVVGGGDPPDATDTTVGPPRFPTVGPGGVLPDGATCAEEVAAEPRPEVVPANTAANTTVVEVPPALIIDGADEVWNARLLPRITGDFVGTTEEILRWGACKWGFDLDITMARAYTESSWRMSTAGDSTTDGALCSLLDLTAPCAQSYGLLQVKGTVHQFTYPLSSTSTAFGVDYAMAWLRACYEGSFTWLADQGYTTGDEWGCVGAWFSGNWWDDGATTYVAEVQGHVADRTWERLGD